MAPNGRFERATRVIGRAQLLYVLEGSIGELGTWQIDLHPIILCRSQTTQRGGLPECDTDQFSNDGRPLRRTEIYTNMLRPNLYKESNDRTQLRLPHRLR